jgi:hypothetical protein
MTTSHKFTQVDHKLPAESQEEDELEVMTPSTEDKGFFAERNLNVPTRPGGVKA